MKTFRRVCYYPRAIKNTKLLRKPEQKEDLLVASKLFYTKIFSQRVQSVFLWPDGF